MATSEGNRPARKNVRFCDEIVVNDTYSAEEYDRKPCLSTLMEARQQQLIALINQRLSCPDYQQQQQCLMSGPLGMVRQNSFNGGNGHEVKEQHSFESPSAVLTNSNTIANSIGRARSPALSDSGDEDDDSDTETVSDGMSDQEDGDMDDGDFGDLSISQDYDSQDIHTDEESQSQSQSQDWSQESQVYSFFGVELARGGSVPAARCVSSTAPRKHVDGSGPVSSSDCILRIKVGKQSSPDSVGSLHWLASPTLKHLGHDNSNPISQPETTSQQSMDELINKNKKRLASELELERVEFEDPVSMSAVVAGDVHRHKRFIVTHTARAHTNENIREVNDVEMAQSCKSTRVSPVELTI